MQKVTLYQRIRKTSSLNAGETTVKTHKQNTYKIRSKYLLQIFYGKNMQT